MNPRALTRLLLETSGHADQNVARFLARDSDALMDAMRSGKVDELLRGSAEGRALMNNAEFMSMTTKVGSNLDYITRAGADLAAGRNINATEFLARMDIPASGNIGSTLTRSITDFNSIAARGASTAANNADTIAAARRARAPRDLNADEVAERLQQARSGADNAVPPAAARPAVRAADVVADTATNTTGTLSRREVNRILEGNGSTADKLGIFARSGREDLYDRVILQARRHGLKEGDNAAIQSSKLPDALKARVQEISDVQMKGGMAARMDSLRATFSAEGIKDIAANAAAHPARAAYDVFAAQWRAPIGVLRWAGNNKVAAAGAVGAVSGADLLTGGTSTEVLGTGIKAAASGYIAVDSAVLSAGASVLDTAVGLVSSEPAEAVINTAGNAALDTAGNAPRTLSRLFSSATGADQEAVSQTLSTALNNPVVTFFAPGWVRNTAQAQRVNDALHPETPNAGDVALATAEGDAPTVRERLSGAAAGARDRAGDIRDQAEESLEALNIAAMLKDPAKAMTALRGFAQDNPAMQKALDIAEQNPMLKWGLIGGFALGAAGDARSPGQRVANGLKSAMIFGVLLDLMGALFGKPSLIVSGVRSAMNNNNDQNPAGATFVPAPAAPGTEPNAQPTTAAPTATGPAPLKGNFAERAAPPAPEAQPDPASTSHAFRNATLNTTAPVVSAPVPAANDPDYRRSIYMPSSM
jgi:hypothetical protein